MPSTVAILVIATLHKQFVYMDISFTVTGDHVIMWAGFN